MIHGKRKSTLYPGMKIEPGGSRYWEIPKYHLCPKTSCQDHSNHSTGSILWRELWCCNGPIGRAESVWAQSRAPANFDPRVQEYCSVGGAAEVEQALRISVGNMLRGFNCLPIRCICFYLLYLSGSCLRSFRTMLGRIFVSLRPDLGFFHVLGDAPLLELLLVQSPARGRLVSWSSDIAQKEPPKRQIQWWAAKKWDEDCLLKKQKILHTRL